MIELSIFIKELRNQLNSALSDVNPGPVRFELGPVEIEAIVAVDQSHGATGKVNFWVVEASADVSAISTRTHRITVTLHPVLVPPDGSHHSVLITGSELDQER
ncbi:trypco2 family protein [Streptomyces sp. NPDC020766]|uniref:trypco2 family protein n=1 Tax=Streptomyces sp. NPDC020766 TaxID=3155011 RepID=UPI0033D65835